MDSLSTKQQDRRYLRTEAYLQGALRELICEYDYPAITVEMITARASVARKTFYAHHENRESLLWATMEAMFDDIVEAMTHLDPDTLLVDGKPLTYPLFVHVQIYARFYRVMLSEAGTAAFILRLWSYLAEVSYGKHAPLRQIAPQLTVPPLLMAEMLAGAALGAVRWWLANDLAQSPETMAYTFSQIMAPGILAALGLDEF